MSATLFVICVIVSVTLAEVAVRRDWSMPKSLAFAILLGAGVALILDLTGH